MAEDYSHCLWLAQQLAPELRTPEEWDTLNEDWATFSTLSHGDNEPFAVMRAAMEEAIKAMGET